MATKRFFWKVWLRPNVLTKGVENDYVAEVSTFGKTLRNEDIAQLIKEIGSELQYETLLDALNRADRLRCQKVQQGYSVRTGLCQVSPRVTGSWQGSGAHYDEAAHRISCDLIASTDLRNALTEVGVEVLGAKHSSAYINLVTDVATGRTDGGITPNDDIIVEGNRIKLAPEGEAAVNVFFVADDGTETPIPRRPTQNDPKKLIIRVPLLAAGTYLLKVVTMFSTSSTMLKEPRSIEYGLPLVVDDA
jgi:hypothetical protein